MISYDRCRNCRRIPCQWKFQRPPRRTQPKCRITRLSQICARNSFMVRLDAPQLRENWFCAKCMPRSCHRAALRYRAPAPVFGRIASRPNERGNIHDARAQPLEIMLRCELKHLTDPALQHAHRQAGVPCSRRSGQRLHQVLAQNRVRARQYYVRSGGSH